MGSFLVIADVGTDAIDIVRVDQGQYEPLSGILLFHISKCIRVALRASIRYSIALANV